MIYKIEQKVSKKHVVFIYIDFADSASQISIQLSSLNILN